MRPMKRFSDPDITKYWSDCNPRISFAKVHVQSSQMMQPCWMCGYQNMHIIFQYFYVGPPKICVDHPTYLLGVQDFSLADSTVRKCKILARLTDHLYGWWVGGPSQFWVVHQSIICWDQATNNNGLNGPNAVLILLRHNGNLIAVQLWNLLSTFIPKHFLQNLKNPLVAKRTIFCRTLGRPMYSWSHLATGRPYFCSTIL